MSITDQIKDIYNLDKKGATPLELQERITDLRGEIVALQEENLELKEIIRELADSLDVTESLDFDRIIYWKNSP
jgi:hypothetical protein